MLFLHTHTNQQPTHLLTVYINLLSHIHTHNYTRRLQCIVSSLISCCKIMQVKGELTCKNHIFKKNHNYLVSSVNRELRKNSSNFFYTLVFVQLP